MKKYLITTLIDGRIIKRDITLEEILGPDGRPIPIFADADHVGYAMLCRHTAMGLIDSEKVSKTYIKWIGAGGIASVEVKFEPINQLKKA